MALRPVLGPKPPRCRHFETADFIRGEDISPTSYVHPGKPGYPFSLRHVVQNLFDMVGPTTARLSSVGLFCLLELQ
jgi:hypothetical protein